MNREIVESISQKNFIYEALETPMDTSIYGVTKDFIESYYYYLVRFISDENGLHLIDVCNSVITDSLNERTLTERTKMLAEWFNESGEKYLESILSTLYHKVMPDKAQAFSKLYNFLLDKSVKTNNLEALIDNLYFIPEIMKREYMKFGFVTNEIHIVNSTIPFLEQDINIRISSVNFKRSVNQVSCFI